MKNRSSSGPDFKGLIADKPCVMDSSSLRPVSCKIWLILILLLTNLLAFVAFSSRSREITSKLCRTGYSDRHITRFGVLTSDMLVRKLNDTMMMLNQKNEEIEGKDREIEKLKREVKEGSSAELERLRKELQRLQSPASSAVSCRCTRDECDCSALNEKEFPTSNEIWQLIGSRKLPFGWNPALKSDSILSPIGHACFLLKDDLDRYMDYKIGEMCPDDLDLAQKLLLHGCEPLPRRRCFARSPPNFPDPYPVPEANWKLPSDESILWSPYTCKSFDCLNGRAKAKVFADCLDCFDLQGRESRRWLPGAASLDFSVEEVLLLKQGSIRIGLDLGGGTGSFAVRMQALNVTIITTTLDLDGPFNSFVALRGVIPLYLTISQRLPFFDNTLDLVHSMHVLSSWIPLEMFQFILYDIYRVLRPGGLFWLDHFFCLKPQFNSSYQPLIDKMGFLKLKWVIGNKLDRGPQVQEMYLSALLEKPRIGSFKSGTRDSG